MRRKKLFIAIFSVIVIMAIAVILSRDNKDELTRIKVAEATHSVFYAPQYVALAEGFFAEEGLEVEIMITPGTDKVMGSVLSGNVQIGLSGSEATINRYLKNQSNYLVTFAGLTKKDGSFLISREKIENFTLDDLKGKKIIGGRKGGMPEMTLKWALRQQGIDPENDLEIDTSIGFAAMSQAFIEGNGDFVTLFEPEASNFAKEGHGYVVASVGMLSGEVPYTAFNAKKVYIENNPMVIRAFVRAIYKGLEFVRENDSTVIARSIQDQFPDTLLEDLAEIIERYKAQDVWVETPVLSKESFDLLQTIMQAAGELDEFVEFEQLVDNMITEDAIK